MLERLKRLIPLLTVACLAVVPVVLAACGKSGGGNGENAQRVIDETFGGKKKVDSGKLDFELTAKLNGSGPAAAQLKNPVTIKIAGPFQSEGQNRLPQLDLNLTASAAGRTFNAGAVSTGTKGFISYQGTDYAVPDNLFKRFKQSFESSQKQNSSNQPSLSALGIDPKKWLKNPKNEGTENVNGAETIHISSDVDVGALLDDLNNVLGKAGQLGLNKQQQAQLPKGLPSATKQKIQEAIKEAKFDLFTGKDDKTLRKLVIHFKFELPADLKAQAQGLEGGDVDLTIAISDLNKPQTISEPKSTKPLSDLQKQLGAGALGALGGAGATPPSNPGSSPGGTSGASPSPPSSAPNAQREQKYLKCVQNAKKPQDLQKCASLLNGK